MPIWKPYAYSVYPCPSSDGLSFAFKYQFDIFVQDQIIKQTGGLFQGASMEQLIDFRAVWLWE